MWIHETRNGALSVKRNQFPAVMDKAIHKSQGVPKSPKKDDAISKLFERLTLNPAIWRFQFLGGSCKPYAHQMIYHNVQSLIKYYDDIAGDPYFKNSDVLVFTETWTVPEDRLFFEGFNRPHVIVSHHSKRKPSGVSIYLKNNVFNSYAYENYPNYDTGVQVSVVQLRRCRIGALYAKPQSSVQDILKAVNKSLPNIKEMFTILFGNFNIEMNSGKGLQLRDVFADVFNLYIRNDPKQFTRKKCKTTTEGIFSSKPLLCCGVYESIFSDHLPLYARCASNLFSQ